jgi:ketosteroid isomerase-like protein
MPEQAYTDACRVADALAAAIAARDADAIRAIYAEDIGVWHAATGQTQNKAENSGLLAGLFQITSRLSYDEVRRHPIDGGLVEQHILNGEFLDGTALPSLHVSIFIYVRDGLITRIEEYFNSATFDEVWARMAAQAEAAGAAA